MITSPVILFVYNRPFHTKQTIETLLKNYLASETKIIIFSDGPKNTEAINSVNKVRAYLKDIKGFNDIEIIEREINFGIARNQIEGISDIIKKYNQIIVLEDDIICSKNFLSFMNKALDYYKDNKRVFSITGLNFSFKIPKNYEYDAYFTYRASSWGWGTWKDRWDKVDWEIKDYNEFKNNKYEQELFNRGGNDLTDMLMSQMNNIINSWAIRWCYAHYKNDAVALYPIVSKVNNIGFDGSGIHSSRRSIYNFKLDTEEKTDFIFPSNISIDPVLNRRFKSIVDINILKKLKRLILQY